MGWLGKLFGGGERVLPTPVETLAGFEEAVRARKGPVIVNVTSPTCAPCRRLAPVLDSVAHDYRGKVGVVTVSTHVADPVLLGRLGARATPTIIVYEDGEEIGRMVGFRPRGWFDEMIRAEFGA